MARCLSNPASVELSLGLVSPALCVAVASTQYAGMQTIGSATLPHLLWLPRPALAVFWAGGIAWCSSRAVCVVHSNVTAVRCTQAGASQFIHLGIHVSLGFVPVGVHAASCSNSPPAVQQVSLVPMRVNHGLPRDHVALTTLVVSCVGICSSA